MKTYIFEKGRVEVENLNGQAIHEYEKSLGSLIGVKISNLGYVPVLNGRNNPADDLWKLKYSEGVNEDCD